MRGKISTAQLRKDVTWIQSIAKVSVTKDALEHIVNSGIILRPLRPTPIRNTSTQAEREAFLGGWRQTGTRRTCRTEDRIRSGLSADKGTFSREEKPCTKFGTTERDIGRKEVTKNKNTEKRIGQDGAVLLPPPDGVTGDCTIDAYGINLFQQSSFLFIVCEV